MGRLQRKKDSSTKKRKKQKVAVVPSKTAKKDAALVIVDDSAKETKKKKTITAAKPSGITKAVTVKQKSNFFSNSVQFLREVKVELKKVTWPTRKQTLGSTVVVIIIVTIIAFFLGAVDIGLSSLVRLILQ